MPFNRNAALQAGYTDEEINAYLASKQPMATSVSTPTPTRQEGFLSRLVRPTKEAFAGTGRALGTLGQVGATSALRSFAPQAAARVASYQGPGVMRPEELQEVAERPLQAIGKQAKRSAIIGSYAVPFGKAGIFGKTIPATVGKGYFARGALTGGLYGAGQEDATPESILASSLIGGVVSHYLPKILKAGPKVQEKGAVISAGKIKLPKGKLQPTFALKEKEIAKTMSNLGIRGSAPARAQQLANRYVDLTDDLADAVGKIDKPLQTSKYVNTALNNAKLKTDIAKGVGKSNVEFFKARLNEIDNWADLNKLKFQLQGEIGKSYEGGALSESGKVIKAFRDTIDDAIKTASPEAKDILSQLTKLHEITPTIAAQAGQQNLPLFSFIVGGIKVPGSRRIIQGTTDLFGRVLQKGGGILSPLAGLGTEAQVARTGARAPQFLQALFPPESEEEIPEVSKIQSVEDFSKAIGEVKAAKVEALPTQKPKIEITREQVQAVLLNPNIKSTYKTAVLQAYKLQAGTQKSAVARTKIAEAKQALKLIDLIDNNFEELQRLGITPKKGGVIRRLTARARGEIEAYRQVGKKGAAAASYKDAVDGFLARLARASGEVGVLTNVDLDRIKKLIPNFDDTPEVSARNFQKIRAIVGGAIEAYSEEGEFEELETPTYQEEF